LTQNYFELFNLPEKFQIDLEMLQENYRAIQKEIHPDRFATSSENEKVQSMIKSTQANDAFQTLKSPIKRAKYILSLHKSVEKITLPPDFLMQQMEWEEHFETIEKNSSELTEFKSTINKKYKEYSLLISTQIDDDQNWSDAAISIDKLYFIEKLLQKINKALS
jgi:molecular chaperone HscB